MRHIRIIKRTSTNQETQEVSTEVTIKFDPKKIKQPRTEDEARDRWQRLFGLNQPELVNS